MKISCLRLYLCISKSNMV